MYIIKISLFLVVFDVNYIHIFTSLSYLKTMHSEGRSHCASSTFHTDKSRLFLLDRNYLFPNSWVHKMRQKQQSYLFHRSVPGIQSRSSRTHSGSSPLYRSHCFGRGCSNTVWEAPSSRRAWPRQPSGPRPGAGHPYSVRQWIDPGCSPRSRSWVVLSTPRWGTPAPFCSLADPRGRDCHPSPGSHFLRGLCRQYGGCW